MIQKNNKFGYNLTNGGDGTTGVIRTQKQKDQISEKLKGRKLSKETKLKMSISRKGSKRPNQGAKVAGSKNPFYNKKHTPETIAKIILGQPKPKFSNLILMTEIEFFYEMGYTYKEISEVYDVSAGTVSSAINKRKQYKNII